MQNLSDMTFIIPFSLDSADRLRNLQIVSEYLLKHFDTTILIAEYAAHQKLTPDDLPQDERLIHRFYRNPKPYFQRTRSVNLAVQDIDTPYFAIYDTDVLLPPAQVVAAVELLRAGECTMCLPFANRMMWIPREDVSALQPPTPAKLAAFDYPVSDDSFIFVGLVNFLDKASFIEAGMMNEHFRSWGFEEMELYIRLLKLGYPVLRTGGIAYHLGHERGADSLPHNDYYAANQREYHKVMAMNPDDLRAYIASWEWTDAGAYA